MDVTATGVTGARGWNSRRTYHVSAIRMSDKMTAPPIKSSKAVDVTKSNARRPSGVGGGISFFTGARERVVRSDAT